jgi:hypothetical protein
MVKNVQKKETEKDLLFLSMIRRLAKGLQVGIYFYKTIFDEKKFCQLFSLQNSTETQKRLAKVGFINLFVVCIIR